MPISKLLWAKTMYRNCQLKSKFCYITKEKIEVHVANYFLSQYLNIIFLVDSGALNSIFIYFP